MSQERFFKIFTGPMWSSKTTHMLLELEKCKFQGKRAMVFKPLIDDRYSEDYVVSHAGYKWPAAPVKSCDDMIECILGSFEPPDVIAVDEAFMIPKISEALILLFKNGNNILVSSLDLSSQLKDFHEISAMTGFATEIKKLTAACAVCRSGNARYTYKKQIENEDNPIHVGGSELYEPRCFDCHPLTKV